MNPKSFLLPVRAHRTVLTAMLTVLAAVAPAFAVEVGATVGYLFRDQNMLSTVHLDFDIPEPGYVAQQLQLEFGRISDSRAVTPLGSGPITRLTPYLVNYRAIYPADTKAAGYLGVGVGAATFQFEQGSRSKEVAFAMQGLAGFTYKTTPRLVLKIGARFLSLGGPEGWNHKLDVSGIGLEAGASFRF